jgi:P-type Cu2+ transporter
LRAHLDQSGQAAIHQIEGDRALAVLAIADAIRPESYEAVKRLHAQGVDVAMLTSDSQALADSVARELGIDTMFAQVLPEDKAEKIEELQAQGNRVATGDRLEAVAPSTALQRCYRKCYRARYKTLTE